MPLRFEWDLSKADANREKHGFTFDEASTAFGDTLSLTIPDPLHSIGEERYVLMGQTFRGKLVVVVHVERDDGTSVSSAPVTEEHMKKRDEDMLPEYDFRQGVRGKVR